MAADRVNRNLNISAAQQILRGIIKFGRRLDSDRYVEWLSRRMRKNEHLIRVGLSQSAVGQIPANNLM